jgi:alpha-tubulin suppressor-like RCC1 family protein
VGACGDDGTGPPDDSPNDDPVAFLLESLTMGISHTCGLTAGGEAFCWGRNENGRLGDATTTDRSSPVPVAGDLTFRTLSAGVTHTCGITTAGATYCWGTNHLGQLGDGTTVDRPVPESVAGGPQLVSLDLGGAYSCGLTAGGAAYCWGSNVHGQFGNGKELVEGACDLHFSSRPPEVIRPYCTSPVPAALGLPMRTLGTGSWHACGSTLEGTVYCWGGNSAGQVGDSTTTPRSTPVAVASDLAYADLSGGTQYACALRVEGVPDCWGHLPYGYLQEHSTHEENLLNLPTVPEPVATGLKFRSVSVGSAVACGLTDDGAAHCWGDNLHGALGDGTTRGPNGSPRMTPGPVLGERRFQTLVAGYYRACGLTAEGVAYCWGRNDYGQLGDGTTQDRLEPVMVLRTP